MAQQLKNLPAMQERWVQSLGLEDFLLCLGEENGNPLQFSFLGNPMDTGAQQATGHEVAKESDMT